MATSFGCTPCSPTWIGICQKHREPAAPPAVPGQLDGPKRESMMKEDSTLPKWRNWQTRQLQELVPVQGVQVQVLSSALFPSANQASWANSASYKRTSSSPKQQKITSAGKSWFGSHSVPVETATAHACTFG